VWVCSCCLQRGLWGYIYPQVWGLSVYWCFVIPICVAWRMDVAFHCRKETQRIIETWANIEWANNLVHISSKKATFYNFLHRCKTTARWHGGGRNANECWTDFLGGVCWRGGSGLRWDCLARTNKKGIQRQEDGFVLVGLRCGVSGVEVGC